MNETKTFYAAQKKGWRDENPVAVRSTVLGPKLIFVTGLVIFVTAVARLVCPDLLG